MPLSHRLFLLALSTLPLLPAAQVTSPDGALVVTVDTGDEGQPTWGVTWRGTPVILPQSRLGLTTTAGSFDRHLAIVREARQEHDDTWTPVAGERAHIRNAYHELTLDLAETGGGPRRLGLTIRAFDTGVGLRYTLPVQAGLASPVTITHEGTTFAFDGDHLCWPVYAAQGDYAKAGQCPAPLSQMKAGAERPLTVRCAPDRWVALAEAGLVDSARLRLQPAGVNTVGALLDGTKGAEGSVTSTLPFVSPWRTAQVAASAGGLLEGNNLVLNLNEPCAIADTSWIRPGKVMREVTLSTVGAKATIDFCASHGIQYLLFDAGWYGHEYDDAADARAVDVDPKRNPAKGPLDMAEVVRYGATKDVGVILYVNRRALERQLDELLPLYASWGIKGVKYGFVQVGSQEWTSWLHRAIRKAADHHLMVDIHDEFRSTGYSRTYPNLMTVEGVRGNEEFPSPEHNACLPFTRFLTGPADYTFCWSDKRLKNSHAHQMALTVLFFSPWQVLYWYDRPTTVPETPELAFWTGLPTTWDETRVVAGDPGREAVIARRKGTVWYVGAIHPAGRAEVAIPLNFLPEGASYQATVYRDAQPEDPASKAVQIDERPVDRSTVLTVDIPVHGGAAIRLEPRP